MREWLVWLLVAVGLAVAELLSLDLVLIMLAAGAFAAAGTAALGGPLAVQGLVFAVVSALAMFLVRPVARAHLERGAPLATGIAALVGKDALVLEEVGTESGLVKIDGEEWTARPFQDGQVIEPGATVEVITIQGVTALVWRKY
ncbi:MAG: regulator of rane protease YbbK [Mycobacterium sp.]|jgi:membrane protein implicated in regulation of membrane protease activity|nr:regulator of rane protease YbbK [Mycobacterium sp.]